MLRNHPLSVIRLLCLTVILSRAIASGATDPPLASGAKPVWDLNRAYRETTTTRERICLNGLWEWQPAQREDNQVPVKDWGYFKVPGSWPGITDYMQKDSQRVFANTNWSQIPLGQLSAAWYQREFTVPPSWKGRRLVLRAACLNSYAAVYVDGLRVAEMQFPDGEADLTQCCGSDRVHTLSLLVVALPLKGVMLSYTDSAAAREVKGAVARRGLCGDVFLESVPELARISDVRVETSVRRREIRFDTAVERMAPGARYQMRAEISRGGRRVKEFSSLPFEQKDLEAGHYRFSAGWAPEERWDLHTPQNEFTCEVSLRTAEGKVVDSGWPERFGFREFWIEGRDFFLNGSRIFLCAVPLDNAQVSAAAATYEGARETLERLQSFGINCVYTHNYGCEPGAHLAFDEILRAADDTGMLVSFSQPHFSHYDWKSPEADRTNGYARHAAAYVRLAQNHPSVVMYSMSHNATGYDEDMNPDMIDGIQDGRDNWARKNVLLAQRAEAIVRRLDSGRIVYHHASGNLGSMHASNFYPNFAPIQELSDWFEHWATHGIKPMFTCEYGAPFTWDWTMYRGWYGGEREFGSAAVPWEFCLAEWNSQFFGERAFALSEAEKANLRWEAKQFRAGKVWHRWDYPVEVGSSRLEERYPVFAAYLTDNWRAFRTWGVSAISPWEYGHFWKLRDGVDRSRQEFKVDWDNLQRPGFSPDYLDGRYESMEMAYGRSDWVATPAAQALLRNNGPLLAYLAGKPSAFTSKDHNFFAGETVEKQIVVINNSRRTVTGDCSWSLGASGAGHKKVTVATGQIEKIPVRVVLSSALPPGNYEIGARVKFSNGETQQDNFAINVLPRPGPNQKNSKVALFDPLGQTSALLNRLGLASQPVQAQTDLSAYEVLIVGQGALTTEGPAPDISRVRQGLKVLMFEQTSDALEKRLGFRVEEYGLRQVFARVSEHPALAGLGPQNLRDWEGEATLLPSRLKYETRARYGPTVRWCDIPVTRVWRCGNRGNVASVLIEKPARGDFLPVLDGGFSLQFSPLMECREGNGVVIFCQIDVTGRTEREPAAEILVQDLWRYVVQWSPSPRRKVVYAGSEEGRRYLEASGVPLVSFAGQPLTPEDVLVVDEGAGQVVAKQAAMIKDWLAHGGNLIAIGLDQAEAGPLVPFELTMKRAEHISTVFEPDDLRSLLMGVSPADVHLREPREVNLVTHGARILGDGVLAQGEKVNIIFCQVAPWQFEARDQVNVRRTYRRTAFLLARLLGNLGASAPTPILERFHRPVTADESQKRFLAGLYMDQPVEWDDPYRFFRW